MKPTYDDLLCYRSSVSGFRLSVLWKQVLVNCPVLSLKRTSSVSWMVDLLTEKSLSLCLSRYTLIFPSFFKDVVAR